MAHDGTEVPAIEVEGLTRRFGTRTAVEDLHLHVLTGDVYGFLGPNGSGKTTAMRCMLGLLRADVGRVRFFGEPDVQRARAMVGAIIETPAFHVWMSGRDNLEQAASYLGLSGPKRRAEIDRVLARVGLTERSLDRAGSYSLGMKQRLGIARALLGRPRLLMLDEPTNGLDPAGMREMRDLIRSLALHDHITVFISSHLLAEVQAICNRVGILRDGRLRAEGRVDVLLGAHEADAAYEIGATDPAALEAALATLGGDGGRLTVVGPSRSGRTLVRLGALAPDVVLRALFDAGVAVTAFVPVERNLEDVFLEVTR
jgi:ABC-type multidrug transport system ATPase subunit